MREHPKVEPSQELQERLKRVWNAKTRGRRLPPLTPPIMSEEADDGS